jgi:membrane-associated phospholipid phosphatase
MGSDAVIARVRRHQRLLTFGAPAGYAIALGISIALDGLPLARDQLFFWLVLGLAACSVAAWRSWGVMLLEWLPLFALLVGYDYLRGAVSPVPEAAHVLPQIDFDRWLAGGTVPTVWLQERLYDPAHLHFYDVGIWCVYLSHFFAVWIVAAVLWRVAHDRYRRYAALAVLVTLFAFLGYWLYPAQPPWLASDLGEIGPVTRIVPAVWGHLGVRSAQSLFENGDGLVNVVAAMPSLHAAFPCMLLLFFWSAGRWARIGLGAYTLAMAFTLVYGGEHFVIDVLAGWLSAAVAFALVSGIGRSAVARRGASSSAAVRR